MGILDFLRKGWEKPSDEPTMPTNEKDSCPGSPQKPEPKSKPNKWGIYNIRSTAASHGSTPPPRTGSTPQARPLGGTPHLWQSAQGPRASVSGSLSTSEDRQARAIARMEALTAPQMQETVIPSCEKCENGVLLRKGTAYNAIEKATSQAGSVMYCNCAGGKIARGDIHKYKDN